MHTIFFLEGILYLLIIGSFAELFFKHSKSDIARKISHWFSIISLGYLVIAIMFLLISFDLVKFLDHDIRGLYLIVIGIQSMMLFFIAYNLNGNTKLIIGFIAVGVLLSFASYLKNFSELGLLILYLYQFTVFYSFKGKSRAIFKFGTLYSIPSAILASSFFFGYENILLLNSLSSGLFLIFLIIFRGEIDDIAMHLKSKKVKKESYIVLFTKYFVFILVLNSFVLMGVLMGHEFGHIIASNHYGCESRSIFYEQGNAPYTEVLCIDDSSRLQSTAAGFALPLVLVLVLFIVGGKFMREISLVAIGFDLLISYNDFKELGVGEIYNISLSLFGALILIIGVVLLAKSRVSDPGDVFNL